MNGILLVAAAALAVDYGWQRNAQGEVEYIIQIEPQVFENMRRGEEIASVIPPNLPDIRRVIVRVGQGPLPNHNTPPPSVPAQSAPASPSFGQFSGAPRSTQPPPSNGAFSGIGAPLGANPSTGSPLGGAPPLHSPPSFNPPSNPAVGSAGSTSPFAGAAIGAPRPQDTLAVNGTNGLGSGRTRSGRPMPPPPDEVPEPRPVSPPTSPTFGNGSFGSNSFGAGISPQPAPAPFQSPTAPTINPSGSFQPTPIAPQNNIPGVTVPGLIAPPAAIHAPQTGTLPNPAALPISPNGPQTYANNQPTYPELGGAIPRFSVTHPQAPNTAGNTAPGASIGASLASKNPQNPTAPPMIAERESPLGQFTQPTLNAPAINPSGDLQLADASSTGSPSLDINTARKLAAKSEEEKRWAMMFVSVMLFASIGLNFYLFWIARSAYRRYRTLTAEFRQALAA